MDRVYSLALLLTLVLLSRTQTDLSAAADLPPYFGVVSVSAQPLPWTPEVFADFGSLLGKLGAESSLDPTSVRVTNGSGELCPTKYAPLPEHPDRGVVRWSAPGVSKADGATEFRVYFAPKSGQKWEPVRSDAVDMGNLIPNGNLEQVDAAKNKPALWVYAGEAESVTDAKLARRGAACVRLLPAQDPKSGKWQNSIRTPGIPGVVVDPGRSYTFGYHLRAQGTAPGTYSLVSAAQVYWYRADQSYIRHDGCGSSVRRDADWTEMATALQAPPEARFAMLTISFYSPTGSLYLDDFSIVPVQQAQLDTAQSADGGKRMALRVNDPRVLRLDFGKDLSAVWTGFLGVTPETAYTKDTGRGWVGTTRVDAILRSLPDDLARDHVISNGLSRLAVDLPDGDYAAWFLIGDSGLGDVIIPTHVNWSINIAGKEALSYQPEAKDWYEQVVFRHLNEWWTPEVDVYDRFVAPCFSEKIVSFVVQKGQVRFEMSKVPLCAMMVFPASLRADMETEMDRLRADRKRSVPMKFEAPPSETPKGLSNADNKRGYVAFCRDPGKTVLPGSAPQEGESVSKLTGFAAPGQCESFTFSIYPLKNLGGVRVSLSDLVGTGGTKLAMGTDLEVGVVRYVASSLSEKEYRYTLKPGPIQPRDLVPVPQGVTTTWSIKVHVPEVAQPGIYRGRIHIASTKAAPLDLELSVRVVPVKLEATPITAGLYHFDKTYWYIHWWRRCFTDTDGWLRDQTFRHEWDDFKLLQEYGLNSLAFCDDLRTQAALTEGGELSIAPDHRFLQWMDIYAKAGMGPMPWYGFSAIGTRYLSNGLYGKKVEQFSPEWEKAYRSLIEWTKKHNAERGWPEVLFYLSDELSNEGATGAETGRKLVQLTKDIPGIRTVSSMNGPWERVMLPGLKIAMPNHAFPITDESVREIRKAGCDLWMYNISNSRVTWGYYLWKMGSTGRFQWFHRYAITNPWNTFDGDSAYNVTWVTPGKPLPTLELIQIREGIDDLRYLKALEKVVSEARESAKPDALKAVAAAQKDLDELRSLQPDNVKLLIGEIDPKEAGRPAVGDFASCRYLDRYRWLIVSHILAIQKAMGR